MIYASCSQFWTNSQNGMKGCQFEQKTNCALCPFEITSPPRVIQMAWLFYSHLLLRRSKGCLPVISLTSTLWTPSPQVKSSTAFLGRREELPPAYSLSLLNPLHQQWGNISAGLMPEPQKEQGLSSQKTHTLSYGFTATSLLGELGQALLPLWT